MPQLNAMLKEGLDELLEGAPYDDRALALALLRRCIGEFGAQPLQQLLMAGDASAIAVEALARGMSREQTLQALYWQAEAARSIASEFAPKASWTAADAAKLSSLHHAG